MKKHLRGFASMDLVKQREIASKGGKAAHAQGTAHRWSREEAREAGRKGGVARARRQPMVSSTRSLDQTPAEHAKSRQC